MRGKDVTREKAGEGRWSVPVTRVMSMGGAVVL